MLTLASGILILLKIFNVISMPWLMVILIEFILLLFSIIELIAIYKLIKKYFM